MNKKTEGKIIDVLLILSFIIFTALGIIAIITKNAEFIYDRFFSAALVLFGYFIHRRIYLRLYAFLLTMVVVVIHHLKLYGLTFYGFLEFDMIMHFSAGFAIALVLYGYLKYEMDGSKFKYGLIAFLCTLGITSLNEIIEYFGYYFLGPGEGLLFYGTGDFGGYADTAWDLVCNTLGAFFAVFLAIVLSNFARKKQNGKKKNKGIKNRHTLD